MLNLIIIIIIFIIIIIIIMIARYSDGAMVRALHCKPPGWGFETDSHLTFWDLLPQGVTPWWNVSHMWPILKLNNLTHIDSIYLWHFLLQNIDLSFYHENKTKPSTILIKQRNHHHYHRQHSMPMILKLIIITSIYMASNEVFGLLLKLNMIM